MKHLLLILAIGFSQVSRADELKDFVTTSAWGAAGGAVLGLAALALTDNPSDHTNLVTRGASLGLYAGIAYAVYEMNYKPSSNSLNLQVLPKFTEQNNVDGGQVVWKISYR